MIEIALLVSAGFTIGAALLGLVALYQQLGLASLWLAVGLLYVIYAVLQRREASYYDPGGAFSGPVLPAPGKRVLPAPRPRHVTMSRRPTLPGPN
jgi:hypothetical protein